MTVRSFLPAVLLVGLVACSTGGHDQTFWSTATCPQLNGVRFDVAHYRDNEKAFDDVLFFRNDSLISTKWSEAGFHTTMTTCGDSTPGRIEVKAAMVNTSNDWREYAFSIVDGKPDGTLIEGTNSGMSVTYTFSGEEE